MDSKAHKELLRRQFAAQARLFRDTFKYHHSENVMPLIELARPTAHDRLLDVACGWGFADLEFSSRVKSAVGVDLTPEMVELAKKVASERGVTNVEYRVGDAEDLEFGAGSFEIVTCRLTFHHFGDPERALFEMKRVLTPEGRIVLYDFIASSDEKKARRHNEIEVARDPSHVKMYTLKEFQAFFKKCGLKDRGKVTTLMKRDYESWMDFIERDDARRKKVTTMLADTENGNKAGLGVRVRKGKLTFTHTCAAWLLTPKG